MRDYSKVSQSLWRSRRFRPLTRDLKLLYVYLLTCPHQNSIGCFILPAAYIEADMDLSKKTRARQVSDLCDTGLIRVYEPENIVQIDKFLVHNPPCNKGHADGAAKIALSLPDCPLKVSVINELKNQKWKPKPELLAQFDTCLTLVSDGCSTETETETKKETLPIGKGDASPENQIPLTAGKAIFDTGKAILASAEKPPKDSGALINAWLRDHGEQAVWAAMLATLKQGTPDPISYMTGCLKSAGKNGRGDQATGSAKSIAAEVLAKASSSGG